MFGENIDKFKRNRKSRTSPPRSPDECSRLRWTMKIMMKIMMSNARDNLYPFQGGEDGILFKGAKQGANTQLRILEIVCNKAQYIFWDWQNLSITQDLSNTSSTTWAGAPASCDILPFFSYFSTDPTSTILSLSLSVEKVKVTMLWRASQGQPRLVSRRRPAGAFDRAITTLPRIAFQPV